MFLMTSMLSISRYIFPILSLQETGIKAGCLSQLMLYPYRFQCRKYVTYFPVKVLGVLGELGVTFLRAEN